jgi:hypothetical protein
MTIKHFFPAVVIVSIVLLGGCSAPDNTMGSGESTTAISQEPTTSSEAQSADELKVELPDVLHRMQDGTIIAVTDVRSGGGFTYARVEVFNDQPLVTMPSAYFDLVDEEGRRSPNGLYTVVHLAPETGAAFNLSFRLAANSTPTAIAFGQTSSAINNEISLNEGDVEAARVAMQTLRSGFAVAHETKSTSFVVGGVSFTLNSLKRCGLSEGMALDEDMVARYFFDQKYSCLRLDMSVENESTTTHKIDPLSMMSLYDADGLVGLSADTVDGPMLWATLKSGQKIRGDLIVVTSDAGPYKLVSIIDGSIGGISFDAP